MDRTMLAVIEPGALKALLPFVSKDELRENLNGIWLVRKGEYTLAFATNGHILGLIRSNKSFQLSDGNLEKVWLAPSRKDRPLFLPVDLVMSALKGWKTNPRFRSSEFWTMFSVPDGSLELRKADGVMYPCAERGGLTCPDVLSAIPFSGSLVGVGEGPRHVCLDLGCSDAFTALGRYCYHGKDTLLLATSKDATTAYVVQYCDPNVLGLWMPCRPSEILSWEDWKMMGEA